LALAHFEERAPVLVRVDGLRHGEHRELEFEVPLGATLSGRVVDAAGEPVADVTVVTHTTLPFGDEHSARAWIEPGEQAKYRTLGPAPGDERTRRVAHTDSAGRYTLVGLAAGAHYVSAYGTPFTRAALTVDVDATRAENDAPELALAGNGSADFDVRLPANLDPRDVEVALQSSTRSWRKPIAAGIMPLLDESGRLVLRGLPEQECTLIIVHRSPRVDASGWKWFERTTLARVPFVPQRGRPTAVLLDLRPR
jgi:hypothetical protein